MAADLSLLIGSSRTPLCLSVVLASVGDGSDGVNVIMRINDGWTGVTDDALSPCFTRSSCTLFNSGDDDRDLQSPQPTTLVILLLLCLPSDNAFTAIYSNPPQRGLVVCRLMDVRCNRIRSIAVRVLWRDVSSSTARVMDVGTRCSV